MTRIVSKFGIAAALTLGVFSTAAAQTTRPTQTVGVSKGEVAPTVRVDTLWRHDTVMGPTVYKRDTITVTGATMTKWDTVTVTEVPGWLDRGNGLYFGLGAGSYYPSAGMQRGQIPGYAFQANIGVDPAGSPLGVRVTLGLARPDESAEAGAIGARPSLFNGTADLKLRLPFLRTSRFPMFGLYAVGGGAYVRAQDVRYTTNASGTTPEQLVVEKGYHDSWGYTAGGGATLGLGHKRELFLEGRVINFRAQSNFERAHQLPIILGVNWY